MRFLPLLVVMGALAIGLSACGSSSSPTASAAGTVRSSDAVYRARLALARCLRQHGVNVPDPPAAGGPPPGGGPGGFRTLRSDPNFRPAIQACAKYRAEASPLANLSPAQRAQFRQALVKFARCMRSHGVNVPDPTNSPGGGFGLGQQVVPALRDSPTFRAAARACASNLPFRPGGRVPGGGPGGPPGA